MVTTPTTNSKLPPIGGFPSTWFGFIVAVLIAVIVSVIPASAQGRRARLSSDLKAHLEKITRGESVSPTVDVIVAGNRAQITRLAQKYDAAIKESLTDGALLTIDSSALVLLEQDQDIDAVSADSTLHAQLAQGTESTGASDAWAGGIGKLGAVVGRNIGVAVIDSGIDNHTAVANYIVKAVDFTRKGAGNPSDQYGHGTHVAGIIGARPPRNDTGEAPVGMAPGVHFVSLKVVGEDGTGKASDAIKAIDWVVANAERYKIRVINISLGMAPTQ